MHPRRYALIGGLVMLVMGIVAFIPQLSTYPPERMLPLSLNASYGLFLDLFPMNALNKIALVLFGLAGIFASRAEGRSLPASITWSRWVFYVMGVAAILGLIPSTNTLYGVWPLYGYEALLHAVFAIGGAYFGFVLTSRVPEVGPSRKQAKAEIYGN